ncbi:hypothetical protein GDO78_012962 [Eleutherodactylus coqui]|uniref:VWFA domain-containing protein n=1 Tax=Eleutherodactylus coqui TaxID=57060 RepID=A0A8J6K1Q0_ELECQ|nr:hypothetical protein GDO78_012962 [Eleutherodactylus coqui]
MDVYLPHEPLSQREQTPDMGNCSEERLHARHGCQDWDRETERFRVSMNVEAGGEITFTLTYEELLRRQLGKYEHSVSVRPGQIVQNLTVQVTISERTGIEYVRVLPLRSSRLLTNTVRGEAAAPPSTEIEKSLHCARITFQPTPEEQAAQSNSGIAADFVTQYDVTLKDLAGDVQIYNGYFVHYFAPRGLPAILKNVIFVIDVSGSMFGTKMKQTKSAMHVILSDLHRDDSFNIITFSDVVKVWKPGTSIQATYQNIKSAKEYVNKIEADGWTDINGAIMAAASIFNQTSPKLERGGTKQKIPLIIFLTDGEATSGVTASTRILQNAQNALKGTISLFCLAFGEDADYNLMRRLSLENRGIARRIYEYSDATLQLKGFYDEIASPLLFDIELAYLGETAQNVTQTLFPNYFEGSELVVTGKLKSGSKNLQVRMTAHDQKEKISLENDITVDNNATQSSFGCSGNVDEIQWFVQRLWAYFTIQDLLQARFKANDTAARRIITEKATNLSLKYNFVTPVTSLIVVKPDDPNEPKTTPVTTTSTTSLPTTAIHPLATSSHTTVSITTPSTPLVKTKTTTVSKLTRPANKTSRTAITAKISTTKPTTSRPSTTSQVTGTRGQATGTLGITTTGTSGKITTMAPATGLFPNTHSNSGTLHPSSFIPTVTAFSKTEKPSSTFLNSENSNFSMVPSRGTIISTREPTLETVTSNLTTSSISTGTLEERDGDGVQEPFNTEFPTSVPINPTSLRLLILPDETELLPGTFSYSSFVESLNPPPVYSYLEEIAGITVNGHLMKAPLRVGHENRLRTYLDIITININQPRFNYVVNISLNSLMLKGEKTMVLPINRPALLRKPRLTIKISPFSNVTVWIGRNVELLILFHRYQHPTYLQMNHLGFYIVRGDGLSSSSAGLLGKSAQQ